MVFVVPFPSLAWFRFQLGVILICLMALFVLIYWNFQGDHIRRTGQKSGNVQSSADPRGDVQVSNFNWLINCYCIGWSFSNEKFRSCPSRNFAATAKTLSFTEIQTVTRLIKIIQMLHYLCCGPNTHDTGPREFAVGPLPPRAINLCNFLISLGIIKMFLCLCVCVCCKEKVTNEFHFWKLYIFLPATPLTGAGSFYCKINHYSQLPWKKVSFSSAISFGHPHRPLFGAASCCWARVVYF